MIGGMSALQIPGPPTGQAPTASPPSVAGGATPNDNVNAAPAAASPMPSQTSAGMNVDYGTPGDYGGYGAGPNKNNTMLWVGVGVAGAIGFAVLAAGIAVWLGVISF